MAMSSRDSFATTETRSTSFVNERKLTVEEKIIIEKQYVGYPPEPVGPSVGLLFNELTNKDSMPAQVFSKVVAALLSVVLALLLPFIALAIKLTSGGPVIVTETSTGYRGMVFQRYLFRTALQQTNAPDKEGEKNYTSKVGKILKATRLEELPSVINILKGDMKLVGPKVRPADFDNYWNNRFSEYYKRFAIKPGLIGICSIKGQEENVEQIRRSLRDELKYLLSPNLSTDLRILTQKF